MKLTISKETLLDQLVHVIGAVEKKHTSKILENILIQVSENKLQLVGTDLEIEMSADLDIQAESSGQITAPARKLFDICKAMPADCFILLETDGDNKLQIKGLRSRFELATLPADEYPLLDDIPIKQEVTLPEKALKHLLEKVSFSMANQDVRYYLNGLLLEINKENKILAVSTDGHRLAVSEFLTDSGTNNDDNLKIIVPRKGILELSKLLDNTSELPVTLQISDNHIRVHKDNIRFTSKLIDGKYPDYQAAIPSNSSYTIELDREQFRDTLARVAILSNEKFRGIRLRLNEGVMTLHSNNPENESAEEEIDINYAGELFEIGFNVTYMLEAVNHLEGNTIKLELSTPDSSALLHSDDDSETRYVVMPIRL
ncbi:MAG: DNA polymerase III subunit beta [Cocleimonas sp.]